MCPSDFHTGAPGQQTLLGVDENQAAPRRNVPVLQLVLPWPVSVNHYYGQRVVTPKGGKPFVSTYVSTRGKEYREEIERLCDMPAIKLWAGQHFGKPIAMHVMCYPPDKRDRDLGNLDKVLADSLQNCGVLRNDADIWDLRFTRACLSEPPGRVVVRLQAFELQVGQ